MNYCALDDAFQAIGGAPSPGCTMDAATKQARKEERRKARRCKVPSPTYMNLEEAYDPDRQTAKSVDVEPNTSSHQEEFDNEMFHHKKRDPVDQDTPNFDKDPLYNYVKREIGDHVMSVKGTTTEAFKSTPRKRFFGADPDGDSYGEYTSTAETEAFTPSPAAKQAMDFRDAFEQTSVPHAVSTSSFVPSSANVYWKPQTKMGSTQSSFIEHLPPMPQSSNRVSFSSGSSVSSDPTMKEMMRKIEKVMARLDDMNSTASPEQVTSEIMMFISSGVFVLFLMDLLVKKGSTLRF
jgi:hypothetical protein